MFVISKPTNRSEKPAKFQGKFCLKRDVFFVGVQFRCKLQVAKKQGHHRPSHPTSPNLPTVPQLPSSPFVCNEDHQNGKHVAIDGSTTFNEFHVFSYIYICQWFLPSTTKRKHQKKTFKKPSQKINQAFKKPSPQNQPPKSSSHPSIHHTSISDHYITNPKPMHPEGHTQKPPCISPLFDNFSQNR